MHWAAARQKRARARATAGALGCLTHFRKAHRREQRKRVGKLNRYMCKIDKRPDKMYVTYP